MSNDGNESDEFQGDDETVMIARPRPEDLIRYEIRQDRIGDRNDPTIRVTYLVWMSDSDGPPTVRFESSPFEIRLEIDGIEQTRPSHMDDDAWWKFANWVFEGVAGVLPIDLELWEHESYDPEVREAEIKTGWDPNP